MNCYNISKYANVYKIKQQNNQNYLNNYIIFTLIIIYFNKLTLNFGIKFRRMKKWYLISDIIKVLNVNWNNLI